MSKACSKVQVGSAGFELRILDGGLQAMHTLTSLSIRGNLLTYLPPSLSALTRLQTLHVDNNLISHWEQPLEHSTSAGEEETNEGGDGGKGEGGGGHDMQVVGPPQSLTTLTLTENELVHLPEPIRVLTNLTTLEINGNMLTRLPTWFSRLCRLQTFTAAGNRLVELPEGFECCVALQTLLLSDNLLTEVPLRLCKLTVLRRLRLSNNRITVLPRDIARLKNLEELTICGNLLRELPPALAALPTLAHLNVEGNVALPNSLPPGLLKQPLAAIKAFLHRLHGAGQALDLSKLGMTTIPASALADLRHLHELILSNNSLAQLPEEMENLRLLNTLDLRWNKFCALPEFLLNLTSITSLEIGGNPLDTIPKEIHEREQNPFSETMRYLLQVRLSRRAGKVAMREFGFSFIPPQILAMGETRELDLTGNKLRTIPDELCWCMPSLTSLSLRGNVLEAPLPLKFGLLTNLSFLDIASNRIDSLPIGIAGLTRLRTLTFAGNPIKLPSTAMLSTSTAMVQSILGPLARAGVGTNSSIFQAHILKSVLYNAFA